MCRVPCSHMLSWHVPGPTGEWIEELTEKPQHVAVTVLSSTTALTSWTASHESGSNGTIVSVVSLTCQKQKESQRLEKHYCTEVRVLLKTWKKIIPSHPTVCYPSTKGPIQLKAAEHSAPFCRVEGKEKHTEMTALNSISIKTVFPLQWLWPILCSNFWVSNVCSSEQNDIISY